MPDMRLIDANALENRAYEIYVHASPEFKTRMNTLKELIDNAPTIDAVEVVRCRECVHAIVFRTGSVSCRYHDWCRINVDPDGYCNHGEKDIDVPTKDGGAEC